MQEEGSIGTSSAVGFRLGKGGGGFRMEALLDSHFRSTAGKLTGFLCVGVITFVLSFEIRDINCIFT